MDPRSTEPGLSRESLREPKFAHDRLPHRRSLSPCQCSTSPARITTDRILTQPTKTTYGSPGIPKPRILRDRTHRNMDGKRWPDQKSDPPKIFQPRHPRRC